MNPGTAKFRCAAADAAATTAMVTTIVTAMGPMAHPVTGLVDAAVLGAAAAGVVSLDPATCA
jgi:hypothetical protein